MNSKSIIKSTRKFRQQNDRKKVKVHINCEVSPQFSRTLPKSVPFRPIILIGLDKEQSKKVQALSLGKSLQDNLELHKKLPFLNRSNKISQIPMEQRRPKSIRSIKFNETNDNNVFIYEAATPPQTVGTSQCGNCCQIY